MKWEELDKLVRKHLDKNEIAENEIAWIRLDSSDNHIDIVMMGFEIKYGIGGSRKQPISMYGMQQPTTKNNA